MIQIKFSKQQSFLVSFCFSLKTHESYISHSTGNFGLPFNSEVKWCDTVLPRSF